MPQALDKGSLPQRGKERNDTMAALHNWLPLFDADGIKPQRDVRTQ